MAIRTKRGALRRYRAIIRQCYRDAAGGTQCYRAYIQSDPRGCALFILTPETLARWPADQDLSTIYSSGIAVYK